MKRLIVATVLLLMTPGGLAWAKAAADHDGHHPPQHAGAAGLRRVLDVEVGRQGREPGEHRNVQHVQRPRALEGGLFVPVEAKRNLDGDAEENEREPGLEDREEPHAEADEDRDQGDEYRSEDVRQEVAERGPPDAVLHEQDERHPQPEDAAQPGGVSGASD